MEVISVIFPKNREIGKYEKIGYMVVSLRLNYFININVPKNKFRGDMKNIITYSKGVYLMSFAAVGSDRITN